MLCYCEACIVHPDSARDDALQVCMMTAQVHAMTAHKGIAMRGLGSDPDLNGFRNSSKAQVQHVTHLGGHMQ